MDPFTAFSLACGVIQVVDFSLKALAKFKEIYHDGVLSEYSNLEESTKRLTSLQDDLQLQKNASSTNISQTSQDRALLEVAHNCSATAKDLTAKLGELRIQGPPKKRDAFKKTWKAYRKNNETQALRKQLDGYQRTVETKILVDLRQRLDGISLKTDRGFQELNDEVQKLIRSLSQGANNFNIVANAIQSEHKQTREVIVEISRQNQQSQDEKKNRKRLLKSLWFDELHSREEDIKDAHRKTFEWIFQRPEDCKGPWDNFVEWLERGDHIYWIHGKAGSGKSTLMSFLCQDHRLSKSLATWSADEPVLIPRFYFWSGGDRMEKSVEGLLRSLIWQIMNALPELHPKVSQDDLHSSGLGPAWTERRLRKRLQDTIKQLPKTHFVCLFIDGLDEFDGDQAGLVNLLKELAHNTKVKICLSSRPLPVFVRAFGSTSNLSLQDLTREDIRIFVLDKFQEISQSSPAIAQKLTETILGRAEGVFLWVWLAVRDQLRGFSNGDSPELLMKRLMSLPDEIEKVYDRMLSQIEKYYRHEAAIFLQIALYGKNSSLLSHTLASHSGLDGMLSSDENIPVLDLVAMSYKIRSRISTTCGGLLEITKDQENPDDNTTDDERKIDHEENTGDEEKPTGFDEQRHPVSNEANPGYSDEPSDNYKSVSYEYSGETVDMQIKSLSKEIGVHLVHRSAVDFMRDSNKGGAFLKDNTPDDFHPQVMYVKALLADMRLFGLQDRYQFIDNVMYDIWLAEYETEIAQTTLCYLLDNTLSRIHQKYKDPQHNSHWCERWGEDSYEEWKHAKEEQHKRQKEGPQLNLSMPIESIRCQPDTLDMSSLILGTEWNFLTFAASHGVLGYVRHILGSTTTMPTEDAVTYLLHLSIFSVRRHRWTRDGGRVFAGLHFARDLLSCSVDLNSEVSSDSTLWSMFLVRMSRMLLSSWSIITFQGPEDEVLVLQTEFAKTMIALIANGSQLEQTIFITLNAKTYSENNLTYSYRFGLSVWAVAELCLKGRSELSEVRQTCIHAGAPYYARCFGVHLVAENPSNPGTIAKFDLSEAESNTILEIFNTDLAQASESQIRKDLERCGERIHHDRIHSKCSPSG